MSTSYESELTRVIDAVVRPEAAAIDATGEFPRAQVTALGEAGILGLLSSSDVGGGGAGIPEVCDVVGRLAGACASTAMVTLMHFAATSLVEACGPEPTRREIAAGRHLSTLAFSEVGSRSHFWAPLSSATVSGDAVVLAARKSWVTSAGEADSYVWSSRPMAADGPMTLWMVPADAAGLTLGPLFDGIGLRGNASRPVGAEGVEVAADARLGDDGAGFDLAMAYALPVFLMASAAASVGIMRSAVAATGSHLTGTRLEHLGQTLAQQPAPRATFARMQVQTDAAAALLGDAVAALQGGRDDAMLRVLEVKAAAGEAALDVVDGAMRVCGGAAFRKEVSVERNFRDAQAARVMAPTTDALLDFIGRALTGLPLMDPA